MTVVRSTPTEPGGALALVMSRRFGPLFATQFLSAFNDNAVRNALVLMIAYGADTTSQLSAEILIPLAAGLFMLPFFLCSATAGQIADESDKSRLIRLIKLIEIPYITTRFELTVQAMRAMVRFRDSDPKCLNVSYAKPGFAA